MSDPHARPARFLNTLHFVGIATALQHFIVRKRIWCNTDYYPEFIVDKVSFKMVFPTSFK